MNRIVACFDDLKKLGNKALIPYITAGDPNLDMTLELLLFLSKNGADIIELGVPFSDPMADGPVIQSAMERSLKAGTTLHKVLKLVKQFRKKSNTPIVLMGYLNPFFAYGLKNFSKDAREAGVDGVLTVDLPPEEAGEFTDLLHTDNILPIFLVTPVTDTKRMLMIKEVAKGFVYFVSVTGVTGERKELPETTHKKLFEVRDTMQMPVVMGFGISSPDIIDEFYNCADGFVVGSAIMKRIPNIVSSDAERIEFENFFKSLALICHRGKICNNE